MIEVSPYLLFNGNCETAFNFYKSIFSGEFVFLYRYKDVPSEIVIPESEKEKILHVSLPLMKNINLMGMDILNVNNEPLIEMPNNVMIGLRLNNEEETLQLFKALSNEGKISEPLRKTFYADLYGSLTDKFGIGWSFNCNIGRPSSF